LPDSAGDVQVEWLALDLSSGLPAHIAQRTSARSNFFEAWNWSMLRLPIPWPLWHTTHMRRCRLALIAIISFIAAASVILLTVPRSREPRYKGLTLQDWLAKSETQEKQEAILTIGTNNLLLLVERAAYDPRTDPFLQVYWKIPYKLSHQRWVYNILARRVPLANSAVDALKLLGPHASPALPQFAALSKASAYAPAMRSVAILSCMGQTGQPVIMSFASHTNRAVRKFALLQLPLFTNSPAALPAITNNLTDPDYLVRQQAEDIVLGSNSPSSHVSNSAAPVIDNS